LIEREKLKLQRRLSFWNLEIEGKLNIEPRLEVEFEETETERGTIQKSGIIKSVLRQPMDNG
jgi:hypothetical protein